MPQAILAAIPFVVGSVGVGAVTQFALLMGLNLISSKLFGPKVRDQGRSGVQVMKRSALEHRKIVYGQANVSGPIWYNNVSGSDNEYLWYGIALAHGESEDLVAIRFDQESIPKADIAWTAGSGGSDGTGTGDVSTSQFVGANSQKAVQAFYYLGDAAQPVSGSLNTAFADIGTNHRLRGITHIIVRLLYNEDTERVWTGGPPKNISAVIKGRKIYDPRLDSTNGGTGTHRYTDSTTWEWSENPALCVADYLMNFMDVDPATSIDWPSIADAADDCEVAAAIPTATTEDRFTCNGVLSLGDTHRRNLENLLSSMDGRVSYSGGVWKVRASVWEASSVSITADDLAGPVQVRGSAPKSQRFNGVRGFFVDPARNYEQAEFPHITDSTYLTRDNSESIFYDLKLPMTNTATMAQRIAMRQLEQGNNQVVVKLKMNARGAKMAIGDVVDLTLDKYSWSAKTFRVIEWNRNPDSTFDVTLREDVAASYTDPIEGDYGAGNTSGVTLPTDVIPAPSGLSATAESSGVLLSWTNPAAGTFDYIDIYEDTDSSWTGATKIARVRSDSYLVPHDQDGTTYYYWVRAVRLPDLESNRNPNSDTSTVSATMGSTGAAVSGIGASLTISVTDPDNAQAKYRIDSDGDVYHAVGVATVTNTTSRGTWRTTGSAGDYEVGLFDTSGDAPTSGPTLSTWNADTADREWVWDETEVPGVLTFSATVKWRDATTKEILSTASLDVSLDVETGA